MLSNGEAFSSRGVLQGRWSALWSKYNKMRTPGTNPPIMCCHQNILSIFEHFWAARPTRPGYKGKPPLVESVTAGAARDLFVVFRSIPALPSWQSRPDSRQDQASSLPWWTPPATPPSPCRTTTTPTCSTSSRWQSTFHLFKATVTLVKWGVGWLLSDAEKKEIEWQLPQLRQLCHQKHLHWHGGVGAKQKIPKSGIFLSFLRFPGQACFLPPAQHTVQPQQIQANSSQSRFLHWNQIF